jgi:hypothetical protein
VKRHVHMLDLDRPSHPRLRKSSCKDCVAREAEVERLRAALEVVRRAFAEEYGEATDKAMGPGWSDPIFAALAEEKE